MQDFSTLPKHIRYNVEKSVGSDNPLVVSMPPDYTADDWDATCTLTIPRSLALPHKPKQFVFDKPNKVQQRFLLGEFKNIFSDYNKHAINKMETVIIVYEYHTEDKGKAYGNLHAHALIQFKTPDDHSTCTAAIGNLVRSHGFVKYTIEPLRNKKAAWDYLTKWRTKYVHNERVPIDILKREASAD